MAGLSSQQWADIIVQEARGMKIKMTPRQVAEGVGVVFAESGGDPSNFGQGASGHIGAWAEEPSFGTTQQRLDPHASTRAALRDWLSNGKSWWPAWGKWEQEQSGRSGTTRYRDYLPVAEKALGAKATPAESHPGLPPEEAGESSSGGFGEQLMHIGLVGALVLGGAAMIGLGTTRLLGSAGR